MAQRKLQQEVDKCFKKVSEGMAAFDSIFDKIQQATNASQKEKLEDGLKREIKKLQRQRDQIKTWIASNEIKDKKPLLEQRKMIETQMEKFKAVEKEMKTKAYSKEGLSAAAKLDPKEKEKLEACQFLSSMVEDLERQVETAEAEAESLLATVKKGKKDSAKAERVAEIEERTERHKWHQSKLELVLRALENSSLEVEQVTALEEGIRYYVEQNADADFIEDDGLYDELNLDEEEEAFGMANPENDHISAQETQPASEHAVEGPAVTGKGKGIASAVESTSHNTHNTHSASHNGARRPSTHGKSPLPSLAALHAPLAAMASSNASNQMKPAPLPTRAPGETMKYASAAAAAAASSADKSNIGIAPLPPPIGSTQSPSTFSAGLAPLPAPRSSASASPSGPSAVMSQASAAKTASNFAFSETFPKDSGASSTDNFTGYRPDPWANTPLAASNILGPRSQQNASPLGGPSKSGPSKLGHIAASHSPTALSGAESSSGMAHQPSTARDVHSSSTDGAPDHLHESVYHLPPGLDDLIESFEAIRNRSIAPNSAEAARLHAISHAAAPQAIDAERPRPGGNATHYNTPSWYPQEPASIFNDPKIYTRLETDTLLFIFYYRQGTYQQYLAAKALKAQSWRFHKQYQTWFQRHEEPKTITEEYEQGTYRFFDYESTWMNRRKPDFKFAYKYLEDEL